MTKEEKQLLIKILCAMFPYGVICSVVHKKDGRLVEEHMKLSGMFEDGNFYFTDEMGSAYSDNYIPYLRPMSSMTKEEKAIYSNYKIVVRGLGIVFEYNLDFVTEWLLKHHFDYRGLIDKGLALEAPEGMYSK